MEISQQLKFFIKYEEDLCPWYGKGKDAAYLEMIKLFGKGCYTVQLDSETYLVTHINGSYTNNNPDRITIVRLSKLETFKIN